MVSDEESYYAYSVLDITMDQVVTITESNYPKMSFTKFFSDIGGSLGLLLGMGIIQLCVIAVNLLFSKFRSPI